VIFGDIPALDVGHEAGSSTVQLALFMRVGSACRTREIERIVSIRHANFLPPVQMLRMFNFAHFHTKVASSGLSSVTNDRPAIYMKTNSLDNLHFRIKYLTVDRPVNKMCNTQPHPEHNQILSCQGPRPGVGKKSAFFEDRSGGTATCNL
jgi:hypothetical protein